MIDDDVFQEDEAQLNGICDRGRIFRCGDILAHIVISDFCFFVGIGNTSVRLNTNSHNTDRPGLR